MTTSTDTPDTAPGIALQTLLRNAKASALREVIGPSIVDTLQGLDPELDSGTRLGELAASLVEPSEALRDAEMRERIERHRDHRPTRWPFDARERLEKLC